MLIFPAADASDDEWFEFAQARAEDLLPYLREFILERFTYKPRYVQHKVWRSFATASARCKQFDLYFRLFARPDVHCPRETLVIARLMFEHQRAGHGRALVERLVELAPTLGYRYLLIECANANHQPAGLPSISYQSAGLENAAIRKAVCEILEGGDKAFRERARRLRVRLER